MKSLYFLCYAIMLLGANVVQAQCYEKMLHEGDKAFHKAQYSEAIAIWEDAKECSDSPKPATDLNNQRQTKNVGKYRAQSDRRPIVKHKDD